MEEREEIWGGGIEEEEGEKTAVGIWVAKIKISVCIYIYI